jgi:hypothetical protein
MQGTEIIIIFVIDKNNYHYDKYRVKNIHIDRNSLYHG